MASPLPEKSPEAHAHFTMQDTYRDDPSSAPGPSALEEGRAAPGSGSSAAEAAQKEKHRRHRFHKSHHAHRAKKRLERKIPAFMRAHGGSHEDVQKKLRIKNELVAVVSEFIGTVL